MFELYVPQSDADVLFESLSVLKGHWTRLYGTKISGSMLPCDLLPRRYVIKIKPVNYICTSISHPVGSDVTVPVHVLTTSTTQMPTTTTEIGWHDNYGCMMNEFYPDGAQVNL